MYRRILALGKHTAIYGLGSLGTRLLGFFLIPVYTRVMSPADYGILALCSTTVAIVKILSTAGLPSAVVRTFLLTARTDSDKSRVLGTAFTLLLTYGALIFGLFLIFRAPLARAIFGSGDLSGFIVLIAILNLAYVILAVRNSSFRMREQSTRFSLFTFLAFFLNLGLALSLVVGLRMGAWGAVLANTLTMVTMALLFLPWAAGEIRKGFSSWVAGDLLSFGLPLVPMGLALWVMNLSDIYILRIFRTPEEVGIYNLGYKFGLGIYLLANAFKLAFPHIVFTEAERPEAPALFARVATYYSTFVGFLCLAIAVFAPELILVADARFHAAQAVIPLAVFAYFFFGLVSILEIGIVIKRKVHYMALLFLGGAAMNIGLNLLLVPRYGMMAAAWSTLVTYVVLPAGVYVVSRRLYPFHLEWGRLARLGVLMGVVGFASRLCPLEGVAGCIAYKLLLLLCFPCGLLLLRFFTAEEKDRIRQFRGWRPGRSN